MSRWRKIWYLPLEYNDMRPTSCFDREIRAYLEGCGSDFCVINFPELDNAGIKKGSFLDAPTTIQVKMQQLSVLAYRYGSGQITDDDLIFTQDIWFPGLTAIPYLNYFCKVRPQLRGLLHAGTFTDTDFVRQLERWGAMFENCLFDIVDKVFVASDFIRDDVLQKRLCSPDKIEATGWPNDYYGVDQYKSLREEKEELVVFCARNVDEKQPWKFEKLADRLRFFGAEFINTQAQNLSREQYYMVLNRAKVIVSFALQENFGHAIMEAVHAGCIPIVPDRCAYPEFYPDEYRFRDFDECVEKVMMALSGTLPRIPAPVFPDAVKRWFE